jgi:hypothetical protein
MRTKNNLKFNNTPSHVILSPSDNDKVLNFINFDNIGSNSLLKSSAFRKIQLSSKANMGNIFNSASDFSLKYDNIRDLYLSDSNSQDSNYYGIRRQHNFNSISSVTNNFNSNLDNNSLAKLTNYNFNISTVNNSNVDSLVIPKGDNENKLLTNSFNGYDSNSSSNEVESSSVFKKLNSKNTGIDEYLNS